MEPEEAIRPRMESLSLTSSHAITQTVWVDDKLCGRRSIVVSLYKQSAETRTRQEELVGEVIAGQRRGLVLGFFKSGGCS